MVNAVSIARYSAGNKKQYRKGKRIKHAGKEKDKAYRG